MNRLFAEVVGGVARRAGTVQGAPAAVCAPAIDVLQNGDDLVVRAELPGTKPEDVDITVDNGVLTISGRVQEERQEEQGGYLARERRSGSFRRSLWPPQGVTRVRSTPASRTAFWRSLSGARRRSSSPSASR
jgi:HSP20 family protein